MDWGRIGSWVAGGLSLLGGVGVVAAAAGWGARRLVDHRLDVRLAAFKGELDRKADLLRHELQREMVKVELSANRLHIVYPRLFEKLQRAHGAISVLLGARFAQSYEGYDRADIESEVAGLGLPGGLRDKIMSLFDEDRDDGIAELKRVARRVEIQRARIIFTRAKNYLIIKSLYASREVKEAALQILEELWKAWVQVDVGSHPKNPAGADFEKFDAAVRAAQAQLDALEELMRRELHPR